MKVVDFGTATLLQPDRRATTSMAPPTPYASPEQLTGTPVGTASVQYNLAIVLFELLASLSPFGCAPVQHRSTRCSADAERASVP